jgi:hypothetical protein
MLYCSAESWRCMRQQRWSGATSGPPLNESGMLWKGSTTDGNGVLLWGGGGGIGHQRDLSRGRYGVQAFIDNHNSMAAGLAR